MLVRSDVTVTEYLRTRPARNAFVLSLGDSGEHAADLRRSSSTPGTNWESVAEPNLRDVTRPSAADLAALTESFGAVAVAGRHNTFKSALRLWYGFDQVAVAGVCGSKCCTDERLGSRCLKTSSVLASRVP